MATSDHSLYGWDWSATTHDGTPGVVDDLLEALGSQIELPGKGLQGWVQSVQGYDARGDLVGTIYYGGRDDVHVVSTSAAADLARAAVVGINGARTSRVDTRVDTLLPWDQLVGVAETAAARYDSLLTDMSSRSARTGESKGRTLYVGAPSSAVRVRIYEKWLESPGQYPEGTNRVEVQLRPASKVKERVSSWSAAETFCASKVTRDLAELLGDDAAPKNSLHVAKGTPDLERTMRVLGDQYGPAFRRFKGVAESETVAIRKVLAYLEAQTASEGLVAVKRDPVTEYEPYEPYKGSGESTRDMLVRMGIDPDGPAFEGLPGEYDERWGFVHARLG